jgi:hypothetical protein
MKKATIGVLIGLFLLSISVTAQAYLSPNLIQNNGFEITTGDPIISGAASGTALISGQWYSWRSVGVPAYWDNIQSSGGHVGRYPLENVGDSAHINDYLVQSFQISSVWSGHVASAGPAALSLWYIANGAQSFSDVRLFGSDTQPHFGIYDVGGGRDTSGYGTLLGTLSGFSATSTWTQKTLNLDPTTGYKWYTLEINGTMFYAAGRFFGIDDVSVKLTGNGPSAVPIPPAIWLLGSGLLGIAVIRRRAKSLRRS